MTVERKYTLAEIDEMRSLVRHALLPRYRDVNGDEYIIEGRGSTPIGPGGKTTYTDAVDPLWVEAQLRTYIAAGLGPEDLKAGQTASKVGGVFGSLSEQQKQEALACAGPLSLGSSREGDDGQCS